VLASALVEILVCPRSKQPLIYFPKGEANTDESHAMLVCPSARLRYRIQDRRAPAAACARRGGEAAGTETRR